MPNVVAIHIDFHHITNHLLVENNDTHYFFHLLSSDGHFFITSIVRSCGVQIQGKYGTVMQQKRILGGQKSL